MENEKIQEYIDIVYDNYDTSILNFPTALGTPNFLFNKIVKESNKNRQHTLFLVRNKIILNQIFNEFYFYMGENSNTHGINTFYEFSNGSMVIFKICNQVENPIFTHSENIIIYNPYDRKFVTVRSNISGTASVRGADVLYGVTESFPAKVPIDNIVSSFGGISNFSRYGISSGMLTVEYGNSVSISADTAIKAQTWTTIDLIAVLLQKEALQKQGIDASASLDNVSQIRVYVKYKEDIPEVKRICDRILPGTPAIFVHSDVCRDGWLVEIEATAAFIVDTTNIQQPDYGKGREMVPAQIIMPGKTYKSIDCAA